jgi:hypothetical protein
MSCLSRTLAATVLAASTVHAQPVTETAPLAQIRDEKQLADALAAITQDPTIPVDEPAIRALAQALMTEGVKQLQARSYDQALANFLDAYSKFPSPKILLNIASTLRDMGRLADAANTYQRYLLDPSTGAERVAEVKEILLSLDEQLTILTVRVAPRGSDISIDGGPFIPVGSSLLTRVRPGIHLVRIRKDAASNELTINGFEGENKEVLAALKVELVGGILPTPPPAPAPLLIEEHVDGWLITGTQYASENGAGRERRVRSGTAGPEISAIVPRYDSDDDGKLHVHVDSTPKITSGVIAVLRIDGEGRGLAAGFGIAVSRANLEAEVMLLKSDSTGGYLGMRYRLLTGFLRPYLALGVPGFAYDEVDDMGMETSKRLAIGLRVAGGVELRINGHFSVAADLGYEHFFFIDDPLIDTNIFVPTLGVIGRL